MKKEKVLVYNVREAAEVLGISKGLLYAELKKNPDFPRMMLGARIVIPVQKLEEYINS